MSFGLIGKKIGMTRFYDEKGVVHPVTVIHVGENVVTQVKTQDKDGYESVQLGYGDKKESRTAKAQLGHFKKAGATPKARVREFRRAAGDLTPGSKVAATLFQVGQRVDVIGVSKGKGFAGVIKKHNMTGQPESHGSMMHRRTGAIGMRSTPGRIWKNAGMPGHLGSERKTIQNLTVLQVREQDQVLLVQGAVPGANGSFLIVREAVKKSKTKNVKK
ncbi:MAG: 50S ribosomal protein L3 [Verrucomicrobiia bacterium]